MLAFIRYAMSGKNDSIEYEEMFRSFQEALRKAKKHNLPDRFYPALFRNLNELRTAILDRRALVGLESARSKHGLDFFRLAYNAIFNDMIAHAIKVLDKDSESATFWYIYRCDPKTVLSIIKDKSHDLNFLEVVADKLKCIRDKTHFHIDKSGVLDPRSIWSKANLKGNDLGKALEDLFYILKHVYKSHLGKDFPLPEYNGSDATDLIYAAQRENIIPTYRKNEES
jgi:hypothetical protein